MFTFYEGMTLSEFIVVCEGIQKTVRDLLPGPEYKEFADEIILHTINHYNREIFSAVILGAAIGGVLAFLFFKWVSRDNGGSGTQ